MNKLMSQSLLPVLVSLPLTSSAFVTMSYLAQALQGGVKASTTYCNAFALDATQAGEYQVRCYASVYCDNDYVFDSYIDICPSADFVTRVITAELYKKGLFLKPSVGGGQAGATQSLSFGRRRGSVIPSSNPQMGEGEQGDSQQLQ